MITLVPLDQNNPDHVGWMYKVRSHPEVAAYFFAPPPASFFCHVQFLVQSITDRAREFFIIYSEDHMCGFCQIIHHADTFFYFHVHPDVFNGEQH